MSTTPKSINDLEQQCPKCLLTDWQPRGAVRTHVCPKAKGREVVFVLTGKTNR